MSLTGVDLQSLASEVMSDGGDEADIGRKAFHLRNVVTQFQHSLTLLEKVVMLRFLVVSNIVVCCTNEFYSFCRFFKYSKDNFRTVAFVF